MNKLYTKLLTMVFGLIASSVFANMGPEGFYNFPNYYFVETGAYGGDGMAMALETEGYTQLYSMEIDPIFVRNCRERFSSYDNVRIVQGNSGKDLWKLIKKLNKPITFWLDGHNGTPDLLGGKNTPLIEELAQIKKHSIKTHTILIDDMHCLNTILFDYLGREDIIKKILEINPNYVITYMDGGNDGEYPNNIMIARVPGK